MIRLIDGDNKSLMTDFEGVGCFYIKIRSLFEAYGVGQDFLRFYCELDGGGFVTAVLSLMDGHIILAATDRSDFDELKEFIGFMARSAEFDAVFADRIDVDGFNQCICYIYEFSWEGAECSLEPLRGISVSDAYALQELCGSDQLSLPDFDSYYVDLSHRIRHGTAEIFVFTAEDECIACAVVSSITPDGALISGVAVHPDFRGKGYGYRLMKAVTARMNLKCGCTYVQCSDKLRGFYERLNPTKIQKYIRLEFNNG